ncbi:hypothetical protein AURDEDRAFT_115963 [Auricularia subglabra TFB-10046 SS5]|uniref:Uncharacterized protein n=1 Tax=Auricularia subglabra (strain TFB-10046 / SS5) TaxID=717982 RepID=J0D225_AURST|nr:hypothetical protein AURDEDRAFT_115963 [Auricularia subglabra TFB-10046 SS5]
MGWDSDAYALAVPSISSVRAAECLQESSSYTDPGSLPGYVPSRDWVARGARDQHDAVRYM